MNPALTKIELFNNNLYGDIPPELGLLTNLVIFTVQGNSLNGTIPAALCGATQLVTTNVANNPNIKCYPKCLSTMADSERITGGLSTCPSGIPARDDALCALIAATNIGNLTAFEDWKCSPTGYTSTDPCDVSRVWNGLTCNADGNITSMSMGGVGLIGSLPSELGRLQYLEYLSLPSNQLNGSIPWEIGSLTMLTNLVLKLNIMTGKWFLCTALLCLL